MAVAPVKWMEILEVKYSFPAYVENMVLACIYKYENNFKTTDLLDAYTSFDWSYYFSVTLSVIIFLCSWSLCAELGKRIAKQIKDELDNDRKPSYWLLTCAILDQDQFPNVSRATFSILSACISILFFVLIDCFMLNTISTDLVVFTEPKVIKSLQDILDRDDVQAVFIKGLDEDKFFKEAKEGSVEEKVWKRKSAFIEGVNEKTTQILKDKFMDQEYVAIIRDWVAYACANTLFPMLADGSDYRMLVIKDHEKSFINAAMMRPDIGKEVDDLMNKV